MPGGLMSGLADGRDFSVRYNTQLQPSDEMAFQNWAKLASQQQGRDVLQDMYDYDLRGWWQSGQGQAGNGHMTDAYKKPNHPTFSDQSMYSGRDDNQGGRWSQAPDGAWQFHAGQANAYTPAELADYFARVEPGNRVYTGAPLRY